MIELIVQQIHFIGALTLFVLGLYILVANSNMIKKVMGVNIMNTAVFYFFVAIGNTPNAQPAIYPQTEAFANPLPASFILTGIVVSVSITVYALALIMNIYRTFGTFDTSEITRIKDGKEPLGDDEHTT
jgi:multicomponent Na+:H+ antiporter subunit C